MQNKDEAQKKRKLDEEIEVKRQRAIAKKKEKAEQEAKVKEELARKQRALAIIDIRKEKNREALRAGIKTFPLNEEEKQLIEEACLQSRDPFKNVSSFSPTSKPINLYHVSYLEALFRRDTHPAIFVLVDAAYKMRVKQKSGCLESRNVAVVSIRHVDNSVSMKCHITRGGGLEYHSERIALREAINEAIRNRKPAFNDLQIIEEKFGAYEFRLKDLDKSSEKQLSAAEIAAIEEKEAIIVTKEINKHGRSSFKIYYKSRIDGGHRFFSIPGGWKYSSLLFLFENGILADKEKFDECSYACYREIVLKNGYAPSNNNDPNTFQPYLFALRQCHVDIFSDRGPCTFDYKKLSRQTCDFFFAEILNNVKHRFFYATPYRVNEGQYMSQEILKQLQLTEKMKQQERLDLILSIKTEEKKINEEEISQKLDTSKGLLHSGFNPGQYQDKISCSIPSIKIEEQKFSIEAAQHQRQLQNVFQQSSLNNDFYISELNRILSILQAENISPAMEESSQTASSSNMGSTILSAPTTHVSGQQLNEQVNVYYKGAPAFNNFLNKKKLVCTSVSGRGSNCFIYSLLQHATRRYDVEKFEDSLVDDIKKAAGLTQANEEQYPDTPNTLAIIQAINQKYQANLEVYIIQINVEGKPIVLPSVVDPAAFGQRQPIMLWLQANHYVSIISDKLMPYNLSTSAIESDIEEERVQKTSLEKQRQQTVVVPTNKTLVSERALTEESFVPALSLDTACSNFVSTLRQPSLSQQSTSSTERTQKLLDLADVDYQYKSLCEAINSRNVTEVKAVVRMLGVTSQEIKIYRNKKYTLHEILAYADVSHDVDNAITAGMAENEQQVQQRSCDREELDWPEIEIDQEAPEIAELQTVSQSHSSSSCTLSSNMPRGSITTAFAISQATAEALRSNEELNTNQDKKRPQPSSRE